MEDFLFIQEQFGLSGLFESDKGEIIGVRLRLEFGGFTSNPDFLRIHLQFIENDFSYILFFLVILELANKYYWFRSKRPRHGTFVRVADVRWGILVGLQGFGLFPLKELNSPRVFE